MGSERGRTRSSADCGIDMSILWQQIIIGAVIIAAAGYLVWHFVRARKKRPCASCRLMQIAEKKPNRDNQRSVSH